MCGVGIFFLRRWEGKHRCARRQTRYAFRMSAEANREAFGRCGAHPACSPWNCCGAGASAWAFSDYCLLRGPACVRCSCWTRPNCARLILPTRSPWPARSSPSLSPTPRCCCTWHMGGNRRGTALDCHGHRGAHGHHSNRHERGYAVAEPDLRGLACIGFLSALRCGLCATESCAVESCDAVSGG